MAAREKVQHHRLCATRSRLEDNPINVERARTGGDGDTEKQTGSSPEFATQRREGWTSRIIIFLEKQKSTIGSL
jgi:hypothetical protein